MNAFILDERDHDVRDELGCHPRVVLGDHFHFLRIVGPQGSLDDAGGDGRDSDAEAGVERCEGADEAVDSVLGGVVDGAGERRGLACDAGDVDDGFFGGGFGVLGGEEVGDCELGGADGMGEVDVEARVAVGCGTVFGWRLSGWVPEIGEGLLESQSLRFEDNRGLEG